MKYAFYNDIVIYPGYDTFEFISVGKNGRIIKRITFDPTLSPDIYNLAFGDVNANGEIDDLNISDNGDRNKILATIVKVIDLYTAKYPDRWIYFTGSTTQRTRLYRMAASIYLEELSNLFEIFADVDGHEEFIRFHKNLNISAFLIRRKFTKFGI